MVSCCALLASKLLRFSREKRFRENYREFKTFGKIIPFPEGLVLFHTGFCRHGFGLISFWGIKLFASIIYKLARATAWNHEKKQRANSQQCGKFDDLKTRHKRLVREDNHLRSAKKSLFNFGVRERAGFCVNVVEFVLNESALFWSWTE